LELGVSQRPARLALDLLNAAEGVGGNQPLLRGPVERPQDDGDDLPLRPVALPFGMLGEPLLEVDGPAVAVVDLAPAVGLGEALQVAAAFLEGPLAVLALVKFEVALNDIGHPECDRRVVLRALEDLLELLLGELLVGGILVTLEQDDAPPLDGGGV